MTQEDLIKSLENTYKNGVSIVHRKNNDYSRPEEDPLYNFKIMASFLAKLDPSDYKTHIVIHITNKLVRLVNLLEPNKKQAVTEESLEDTIVDMINYAAILKAGLEFESRDLTPPMSTNNIN